MPFLLLAQSSDSLASAGGKPLGDPASQWPTCAACQGPMQYMASIPIGLDLHASATGNNLLLLFQCQQRPGMCEEWSPHSGGNAVLFADLEEVVPWEPPACPTFLPGRRALTFAAFHESEDPETASEQYHGALSAPQSRVVGKTSGVPAWVQYDETPSCQCGRAMQFIAQIEETAVPGLNFGAGGSAYVFLCTHCQRSARLLWQC